MMKKGDTVKDIIYGVTGIIVNEYDNYWAIIDEEGNFLSRTPDSWLQEQVVPFTKEQISKERWFTVQDDKSGGSIWCCESRLEKIV